LEGIFKIETAVNKYKEKFGILPKTLKDLVQNNLLKEIPKDPYGGVYYIDKDGKVRTTSKMALKKQKK
jgi:hypothetical protein